MLIFFPQCGNDVHKMCLFLSPYSEKLMALSRLFFLAIYTSRTYIFSLIYLHQQILEDLSASSIQRHADALSSYYQVIQIRFNQIGLQNTSNYSKLFTRYCMSNLLSTWFTCLACMRRCIVFFPLVSTAQKKKTNYFTGTCILQY